jgi:phosphatidylserine/phosphatidylglycerophosphate/cardiolipin synthase-like enzyme
LVDAERKANGAGYYAADDQMHNKFMIVDRKWTWTGSWNFTMSGLYGDSVLEAEGILGGNTDQVVEIHSPALADVYEAEFQEMWGGSTNVPNPDGARFHARKADNTAHSVQVEGRRIDVYFSPGDGALDHVRQAIQEQADVRVYFEIYAWSDQALLDILKTKWEGSPLDLTGTRTGFDIRGVFDAEFWDDWWSASMDMTGRTAAGSTGNPNTRWAVPAPVFAAEEDRLLHSKCMIVDAGTESDPFVVVGSTNWSANGTDVNDENLLIIHDAPVVDAFTLDFWARYFRAGGDLPDFPLP